jgi:ABC-type antimicrobial peptide transport system permease subunit
MKLPPPRYALKFLRWFCREDYVEEIEGDLTEIFEKQAEQSPAKAKRKFIWSVVKYFRPEFIKSFKTSYHTNPVAMFRHNFLLTYRNFMRYKSSFLLNLIGLSTALASVLLIYLWVMDEVSIDRFHEKDNRLFQVMRNTPGSLNAVETHGSNSNLLPPALEEEMPEVEYAVPMRPMSASVVSAGKNYVKATGAFAGKHFFNAFSYEIIQGRKEKLLSAKYAMAISDELAVKLFGSAENSIGKSVIWSMEHFGDTHTVSGVFRKPARSSFHEFDFFVTHEAFLGKNRMDNSWDSNPILTFLTLKPGVNSADFNVALNKFYRSKRKGNPDWVADSMFIQQYSDMYLYGHYENGKQAGGRIDYVILFSVIASAILSIACINFMNLSTAQALRRIKEVGIKKTIGVQRRTLIWQHLSESMLMSVISLVVAAILVFLFLPQFNNITGKQLTVTQNGEIFSGAMMVVILTGLISGSYPAFYLSGFRPVVVLKGKLNTSLGEVFVRKGLVIFQFCISVLMIAGVVIVYQQLEFVQSKNLGYEKENVILLQKQGNLNTDLESFLAEAGNITGIESVSSIGASITDNANGSWGHVWEGQKPGEEKLQFSGATINFDLIETLGMKMKEGRSFSRKFSQEDMKIVLNETAVNKMGLSDPVGKWFELWGKKREIIGVVKDFHSQSMYGEILPMFFLCNPQNTHTIVLKIGKGTEKQTLAKLEALYKKFNPGIPFEFKFLDDEYQALYKVEQRVSDLSKYFASIAILISCLGLFGLAAFTAERRTKEIGIRKILGCSELRIATMLSGDFSRLVLIAIAIALPLSYYLADKWLSGFAYHIALEWWFFASAALAGLVVAWLTIGTQTFRAARTNPAQCLKQE